MPQGTKQRRPLSVSSRLSKMPKLVQILYPPVTVVGLYIALYWGALLALEAVQSFFGLPVG